MHLEQRYLKIKKISLDVQKIDTMLTTYTVTLALDTVHNPSCQ